MRTNSQGFVSIKRHPEETREEGWNRWISVSSLKRPMWFSAPTSTNFPPRRRLAAAIGGLTEVPPAGDIRPLTGQTGAYRLRVGGFRLLFHIDHQQEVIFVDAIGSRGDIDK